MVTHDFCRQWNEWETHCAIIRILHKCEVLIEIYVPRVTFWYHEASSSDGDLWPEGQNCRSKHHTHDIFFFLQIYGCRSLN